MSALQINCPHCLATNRVPNERLSDKPHCGKCKNFLFTGKPIELRNDNINVTLQKNDVPVLVDCWAAWCGPCQSFAPVFEQAASLFEPKLRFAKLDTEALPTISQQWSIRSIPTLILFKNGKEATRVSGAFPMPQLKQWLQQQGVI